MITGDRLEWRTSSYSSNGENCVQVAPEKGWRASSPNVDGEDCQTVALGDHTVFMRHSKHPDAGVIAFSSTSWTTFLQEVRAGAASNNGAVDVTHDGTDTLVAAKHTGVQMRFDAGEWTAFLAGVNASEFDVAQFAE
ncbi:DUF397 domain-containing protein [Nocardia wallacei]|uniref:DUF397 domain-containing protein n=1 Tax=Nocardia wallacei TaxID=480035 RepID=UPI002457A42C|nr:DUF397 domain-containing protein [Nocardia wallacei]